MEIYVKISTAVLVSFVIAVIVSPFLIKLARKIKFNQPVYEYVDMHQKKQGTPTMGGLIFLIAIIISYLVLIREKNTLSRICVVVMLGYGIIGFLDDFLKIKLKHNEGLKPYQKIIGQLIVAVIVAYFGYKSNLINGEMYIPFTTKVINISFWYIPFVVFFFLAITNSVNLTDGLDGLAGGVTFNYLLSFLVIFLIIFFSFPNMSFIERNEFINIIVVVAISLGAILGYILYNCYPATIFMGDTGSLALGGLIGTLAVTTKTILYVPIIGVMFVVSSLSVIIQVLHYKRTHKRVFLMAPFHHHLEKKSMYETKIVVIYMVITAMMGVIGILLTLLFT